MPDIDLDNLRPADDDTTDLSTLPRGDDFVPDSEAADEQARKDAEQLRDAAGRFKKTETAPEKQDEEEEEEEQQAQVDEEEDEEEDEGEDEDEAADKGKKPAAKNYDVRFHKERQKAERLERELAELRRQVQSQAAKPEPQVDPIEALNTELEDLYERVEEERAEGRTKEAAALQRQIDAKNREILRIESQGIAGQATAQAQEDARYDALLDVVEGEVGAINPRSEDFDPEAVKALEWHVAAYEKNGLAPSAALRMASQLLFGFGRKAKPEAKPETKPDPPAKKPTDIKKAVDTAKKQPPDVADRGVDRDSTKINVALLSDEEFDKLPESKKSQLRGDNF